MGSNQMTQVVGKWDRFKKNLEIFLKILYEIKNLEILYEIKKSSYNIFQ